MSVRARRWAVVVAAGRGQRFGGRIPKQYVSLLGRPVLSWSLGALLRESTLDGIVVALRRATAAGAGLPSHGTGA